MALTTRSEILLMKTTSIMLTVERRRLSRRIGKASCTRPTFVGSCSRSSLVAQRKPDIDVFSFITETMKMIGRNRRAGRRITHLNTACGEVF